MTQDKDKTTIDRRGFLKGVGVGAGAAGVAAIAAATGGPGEAEAAPEDLRDTRSAYRETDHVRRFYQLSRF